MTDNNTAVVPDEVYSEVVTPLQTGPINNVEVNENRFVDFCTQISVFFAYLWSFIMFWYTAHEPVAREEAPAGDEDDAEAAAVAKEGQSDSDENTAGVRDNPIYEPVVIGEVRVNTESGVEITEDQSNSDEVPANAAGGVEEADIYEPVAREEAPAGDEDDAEAPGATEDLVVQPVFFSLVVGNFPNITNGEESAQLSLVGISAATDGLVITGSGSH